MLAVCVSESFKLWQRQEREVKSHTGNSGNQPVPLFFDQLIDHFDNTNQATFKQQYFVNDTYFKRGGPAIFYISGETPLVPSMVDDTYSPDYFAKNLNGLKIALEHRYYGKSFPFEDSSNLLFLSSKQAIADYSMFISFIKSTYDVTKVIVVGGSYAGNLAAWLRSELPHLVDAAVSSSGPLLAQNDYPEYLEHIEQELERYGGPKCLKAMGVVSGAVEGMIFDTKYWEELSDVFHVPLTEIEEYDEIDRVMFATNIATAIAGIVEYAHSENYDESGSPNDIAVACQKMIERFTDNYHLEYVLRDYATAVGLDQELNTGMGYHDMIEELRDTNLSNDQTSRSWMWETCTEFGYYQTSNYSNSNFPLENKLDIYMRMCQEAYYIDLLGEQSIEVVKQEVDDAIAEINEWYGALNEPRDHIYYTNGDIDPWSRLSIRDDLSWADGQYYNGPHTLITDGSHHSDTYMEWTANKWIRDLELDQLRQWLGY